MKIVCTFLTLSVFAFAAYADDGENNNKQKSSGFGSTETFTYELPENFSAQGQQAQESNQEDTQRRQKLLENIRRLYHTSGI